LVFGSPQPQSGDTLALGAAALRLKSVG